MQLIINIVAPLVTAAAVLGIALPTKPGFTSHEITKPDGSKDVLYLRSDFVSTTDGILAGRDGNPPASVPFTAEDTPVANCPIELSSMFTDANSVPAASLTDCEALMSGVDQKFGYWNATNWHALYTLAAVGTCKFSAFRWDGSDQELKVGNLDVWAWANEAIANHADNNQIQVYGNGPCGGEGDTEIRYDIGNTQHPGTPTCC
ncbi:hypothetical protein PG993_003433 [Apiospora rasikravindrae]|uniref:Ecp2 effector protein-like domain-containing protein n=1 Tax=Apiospora rasikravindrae TaxID=990691 RepID=A0ABR1TZH8_9PEZI